MALNHWQFLAVPGIHECSQAEQIGWKSRSQIIEFAAVDVGNPVDQSCRDDEIHRESIQ